MATHQVTSFQLGIASNPARWFVTVRFATRPDWNIRLDKSENFIALATLLRSPQVVWDDAQNMFYSGPEVPGSMAVSSATLAPDELNMAPLNTFEPF